MKQFYWLCCDEEHAAPSLAEARKDLEQHEKEKHKGKPVGNFGVKYSEAKSEG